MFVVSPFLSSQVILSLSATVDYSKLPGGIVALTSIRKSHRDVQINYSATEGCCTLCGSYSEVQAALAQILGGTESAESEDQPAPSGNLSLQIAQKPHESEDQTRKPNKQREKRHPDRPSDEFSSGSHRDLTPGGYDWEDNGQTDGAALQLPSTSEEDFSLILDADMFQYLQKHCQKEYQQILSQYGVDVVDVTNQGLTTLFLQIAAAAREGGREWGRLKLAKKAISQLYEENEAKTRRAQLPKSILSPRGGLPRALEILSVRLPKILLNEDDRNIYIVGSSSDVADAKHFLLLDHIKVRDKKEEDVGSLLRFPSYDSGSSAHAGEERLTTVGSIEDQILRSEEDEKRAEGARRYKLAARFKDSALTGLGSRPSDFTLRSNPSSSRQTRPGPMLGRDVLSEPAGISGEAVSQAQNTGGDILFKSALPSLASTQHKTSLDLIDARPKTSLFSTPLSSLSGVTAPPPIGSGSSLKRASSFSGTPQQKAQVMSQMSKDDSSKSTIRARGRSSSFSNRTGREKIEVYNADLTVSRVMWQHIKEAYSTRVENLTSDVQMKESCSEGSRDLTVTVRGADSSIVTSCQFGLQKLIDVVGLDFSVQKLHLSELGITDTADETLQACCSEVRSRFKKVTIQTLKKTLFLLGPKQLCSQVGATLREVFSGTLAQSPEQHHLSNSSNSSSSSEINEAKSTGHSQLMLENQTAEGTGSSRSQGWKTTYRSDFGEKEAVNGSFSQPLVRKDHVIREKVKIAAAVESDAQKSESLVSYFAAGNNTTAQRVNGVGLTSTCSEKEETQTDSAGQRQNTEIQDTCICVCGKTGTSVVRTKCGVSMCSKCLETVHTNCRVCPKTEQVPWGIRGKMIQTRLQFSVPGHSKVETTKITYCIPDGIQGEGHPSPGKPFQGGTFEAYLPDNQKAKRLVPRLEKAFRQGLTFTVTGKDAKARVTWDCIPHKTSLQGGKSGSGYPDSSYLTRLSEVLTSKGIEDPATKSQE
uniref:E3 ubiquitin-protein ligase n=1 Tax=Stegastes partitus TaxID=144197 RepID=A0A3B5B5B8_9TELE